MKTAEETFDKVAKNIMIEWSLKGFKRAYPRLFNSIILAMEEHARQVVPSMDLRSELMKYELFHKNGEESSTRWIDDYFKYRKDNPCSNCNEIHDMTSDECYKQKGRAT